MNIHRPRRDLRLVLQQGLSFDKYRSTDAYEGFKEHKETLEGSLLNILYRSVMHLKKIIAPGVSGEVDTPTWDVTLLYQRTDVIIHQVFREHFHGETAL